MRIDWDHVTATREPQSGWVDSPAFAGGEDRRLPKCERGLRGSHAQAERSSAPSSRGPQEDVGQAAIRRVLGRAGRRAATAGRRGRLRRRRGGATQKRAHRTCRRRGAPVSSSQSTKSSTTYEKQKNTSDSYAGILTPEAFDCVLIGAEKLGRVSGYASDTQCKDSADAAVILQVGQYRALR